MHAHVHRSSYVQLIYSIQCHDVLGIVKGIILLLDQVYFMWQNLTSHGRFGGGGGIQYNHAQKFSDPTLFSLKSRLLWQEFLGCSNEETNGKSTGTDSVATFS